MEQRRCRAPGLAVSMAGRRLRADTPTRRRSAPRAGDAGPFPSPFLLLCICASRSHTVSCFCYKQATRGVGGAPAHSRNAPHPSTAPRVTWMRFSSTTGPCCRSRTIVACTTFRKATSWNTAEGLQNRTRTVPIHQSRRTNNLPFPKVMFPQGQVTAKLSSSSRETASGEWPGVNVQSHVGCSGRLGGTLGTQGRRPEPAEHLWPRARQGTTA